MEFVLSHYVAEGFEQLNEDKLTPLLVLQYRALSDAVHALGTLPEIRAMFTGFQRYLY